ncbi:T9SS type A sorting domain-containing protein, partial [Calditrichota bacterium]
LERFGYNISYLDDLYIDLIDTTYREVAMLRPLISLNRRSLNLDVVIDSSESYNVSILNNGTGNLEWSLEKQLNEDYNVKLFDSLEVMNITEITSDERVQCVVYADGYYYIAGENYVNRENMENLVYVVSPEGYEVDSFEQPQSENQFGLTDMAYDPVQDLIWGCGGENIFAFDREGNLEQTITVDSTFGDVQSIAWDNTQEQLYIAGRRTDIFAMSTDGVITDTVDIFLPTCYGLAYWEHDRDGYGIYALCADENLLKLYKVNAESEEIRMLTVLDSTANGFGGAGIEISTEPDQYSVALMQIVTHPDGDLLRLLQIDENKFWYDIDLTEGTIYPENSTTLEISFDSRGLSRTFWEGRLHFMTNTTDAELWLPLSMNIVPLVSAPWDEPLAPISYAINSLYPNPFNGSTRISYTIPTAGEVTVALFDLTGREVRTVHSEWHTAGNHQLSINAVDLAAGVYVAKLSHNGRDLHRKFVLTK